MRSNSVPFVTHDTLSVGVSQARSAFLSPSRLLRLALLRSGVLSILPLEDLLDDSDKMEASFMAPGEQVCISSTA